MASKTVDEYPDCARCPNRIFSNYSPLIKFKDDNLYHVFKQRFADDINWVNENRNNYGINFIND